MIHYRTFPERKNISGTETVTGQGRAKKSCPVTVSVTVHFERYIDTFFLIV
jgi:hypothetical protein